MLKDYRILAAAAIALLVITLAAVVQASRREYAGHQRAYYKLAELDDAEVAVDQLTVKVGGQTFVDRCMTCHLGVADPAAAEYPQPLTTHPAIAPGLDAAAHDFRELGCVACHGGNGRGLASQDAHGRTHDWPRPLLTGKFVQSGCSQCHDASSQDLRGAPALNRGRQLFLEKACWACHTIERVSDGKTGPVLSDAGRQFNIAYLRESITDPTANLATSRMPRFDWVDDDEVVDALVVYLGAQRLRPIRDADAGLVEGAPESVSYFDIEDSKAALGEAVFMAISPGPEPIRGGCVNCHAVRDADGVLTGGSVAPELTYAMRMRSEEYLADHISDPKQHVVDTDMPPFASLNQAGRLSVLRYLETFTFKAAPKSTGQQLYETYCSRCHGERMDGKGVAHRMLEPRPRDFRYQFVRSYESRLATAIADGVPGTAMPPWKNILAAAEIESVLAYIRTESDKRTAGSADDFVRVIARLPQEGEPERLGPAGSTATLREASIDDGREAFGKHCTACHGKLANGKGPNVPFLGHTLPRNLTNSAFFARPEVPDGRLYRSIRLGVPGTSMLSHDHLRDQTILDIMAYLRSLHGGAERDYDGED